MSLGNILVTGGAGYIGSHACKALEKAGYNPICYDNLVAGHRSAVKWGPFEEGDISDRRRLDEVIDRYHPKGLMHFAAYLEVGESVKNPAKYYENNVKGSLILFEAMRDHAVKNIVFSSTCAVYGEPKQVPIKEDHPRNPINPYGRTKAVVEGMLEDYSSAYDLKATCLRYFNAAGADPEGETGEAHDPESHLIPLVLDAATGKRDSISIFGTDYETKDGTCIRDYIHVTDLAQAHVLALQKLESQTVTSKKNGGNFSAYNLGNGLGFSVKEVIDAAKKITKKDIPVTDVERREGDPPKLIGDSFLAKKELKWKPKYAELSIIIQTAWAWHQKINS
jgi:UDP-arabinose 4-epimerase